jgi:hypothetical protein
MTGSGVTHISAAMNKHATLEEGVLSLRMHVSVSSSRQVSGCLCDTLLLQTVND